MRVRDILKRSGVRIGIGYVGDLYTAKESSATCEVILLVVSVVGTSNVLFAALPVFILNVALVRCLLFVGVDTYIGR